ncbi:hypothetical protein CR513_22203, partial [Mucuna pruriens]
MEEETHPIRRQKRRRCQEGSDETTCHGIINPISDSQWVSLVQVVPKKSGMTIMNLTTPNDVNLLANHNSTRGQLPHQVSHP